MQRPSGLYLERRGAVADAEIVFDGNQITLFGRRIKAYTQQALTGTVSLEKPSLVPLPWKELRHFQIYLVLLRRQKIQEIPATHGLFSRWIRSYLITRCGN